MTREIACSSIMLIGVLLCEGHSGDLRRASSPESGVRTRVGGGTFACADDPSKPLQDHSVLGLEELGRDQSTLEDSGQSCMCGKQDHRGHDGRLQCRPQPGRTDHRRLALP